VEAGLLLVTQLTPQSPHAPSAELVAPEPQPRKWRRTILAVGSIAATLILLTVIAAVIVLVNFKLGSGNIHAYVSRSGSMCPTVCEGERILADLAFYSAHQLTRGDVVMFEYEPGAPFYVKRIIALPGDTVTGDAHGRISVNGTLLSFPPHGICGQPPGNPDSDPESVPFPKTTLHEGEIFLVGDNLNNSFDSRIPGFATATIPQVRGKLQYIYWSSGSGRIGCAIQ
jgi:signal peptidase I